MINMFGILAYPSPLSVTCRNHFRAKNKPWLDFWDAIHSLETVQDFLLLLLLLKEFFYTHNELEMALFEKG